MGEEYKKPRKKSYDDSRQMLDLVERIHKFSEKRYPFLIGTIVYIVEFLIKRLAFNIKAITRENAGTRTYGLNLIIEGYLLQKLLIGIIYARKDFDFHYLRDLVTGDKKMDVFWWPNFDEIGKLEADQFISYVAHDIVPFIFGYIFLFGCFIKLTTKIETRFSGIKENSFDSGESIFFKSHIGKKIGTLTITQEHIKTYAEPALIAFIGLILWKVFDSALGAFFIICAAASFYEDYQIYYKRWATAQDVIDGEFEAKKLRERLDSRKDIEGQTNPAGQKKKTAPVTFATKYDFDKYKEQMKTASNGGNAVKIN